MKPYQPRIGAWVVDGGVAFRVWAPEAQAVEVVLEGPIKGTHPLTREADGYHVGQVANATSGQLYRYRVDGGPAFPDVASRFQPQGVHGPSQVVELGQFPWTDARWPGIEREEVVIYELHVGTFTPEGTFEAAIQRLPYLLDLGVTAIELMPLGDFPGERNWGYDCVAIYAPARCYGSPADLQEFVDAAHKLGLAVFLDVVYNHLGPDGNYTGAFSPYYVTKAHQSPWGDGLNYDGQHCEPVRAFFLENALYWLGNFHFDGLRLDATHAIIDLGPKHFLAELKERVLAAYPERKILLIAEDNQNLNTMLKSPTEGGWGLDGVWADDFHHEMRRIVAGDAEGYYRDFRGRVDDLARIVREGWLFSGEYSVHDQCLRGTSSAGLDPSQFVLCIQNHDQVGNRAFGERLHHQIDLAAFRAASAVLLTAPQIPLMFMGQEWGTSAPFCFFTDHNPELGKMVTQGRRREFGHFQAFADPKIRETIPDPQGVETFFKSKLPWEEREIMPYAGMVHLVKALLTVRKEQAVFRRGERLWLDAMAWDEDTLVVRQQAKDGTNLLLIARLRRAGDFRSVPGRIFSGVEAWEVLLHTEEACFTAESAPLAIEAKGDSVRVTFSGPGALLMRGRSTTTNAGHR